MSIKHRDYDVRVWADGDVNINCHDYLGFAQYGGSSGIQTNCEPGSRMDKAIRLACIDVASAMRALDEMIEAADKEVGHESE